MRRRALAGFGPVGSLILALMAAGSTCGCRNGPGDTERRQLMPEKTIEQVQQEHTDAWMAIPGVVGTAIGQCGGKPCILILTAAPAEQIRRKIPETVEGYPVVVQHIGEVRALDK